MNLEAFTGQPDEEALFHEIYKVIVIPEGQDINDAYAENAFSLFKENMTPLFTDFGGWAADSVATFSFSTLQDDIDDAETLFVALGERRSDKLVGFTYALPDTKFDKAYMRVEANQLGLSEEEYRSRQTKTAEIGCTLIQPEHRGKGGWSHMMDALEVNLRNSGKYMEMTRLVRQENNYANKIERRYQRRITTKIPDIPSPIGPQTYFRIRL